MIYHTNTTNSSHRAHSIKTIEGQGIEIKAKVSVLRLRTVSEDPSLKWSVTNHVITH